MSNPNPVTSRRGLSATSLITGLASIVCAVVYLVTDLGWLAAAPSLIFGLLGVGFGIAALAKSQPKGMAVTGIVTGAISVLFIVGLFLFALLFLGVLTGEVA